MKLDEKYIVREEAEKIGEKENKKIVISAETFAICEAINKLTRALEKR